VGAHQDRVRSAARDLGEQVASVRAGRRTGVILLDIEPDPAQFGCDAVRTRPLVAGRALDRAQRRKRLVEVLALALARAPPGAVAAGTSLSACASAAPTNSLNSGAGRSGRDLNSGWNCEAT
jgi:hypothetical protein